MRERGKEGGREGVRERGKEGGREGGRGKRDMYCSSAVEPLSNGHVGDEHFFYCSEVVHSSEVEMYGQ